jgi:hypothetical protein
MAEIGERKMKKKILSAEDLKRLTPLTGEKSSSAAAATAEAPPVEATEATEASPAAAEGPKDLTADLELAKTAAAEADEKATAALAKAAGLEAELAACKDSLAKANEENSSLAAKLVGMDKFRSIVAEQTTGIRVALSLAAVDMKDWTPEALFAEYHNVVEAFEKFPIGSVVPQEQGAPEQKPMSSHEAAGVRALGF